MDFTYPAEAEAFRAEFRAWLDVHLTDDIRALGGARGSLDPGWLERMRAWTRTLAEARYAAIAWPEEYGGRGAGVLEQVVWTEEMHQAPRFIIADRWGNPAEKALVHLELLFCHCLTVRKRSHVDEFLYLFTHH